MNDKILNSYPKKRFPLDAELKPIYKEIYKNNRDGLGIGNKISQILESWQHKIVEKRAKLIPSQSTLEIGAGNFNHLKYLSSIDNYEAVEPNSWFYKNDQTIRDIIIYKDLNDIPKNKSYQRIFSINVLEHIEDLPNLVHKSYKLLNKGGLFQAAIPCEGELSWYLGWRLGTGIPFYLKYKKDWGKMIKHEHINNLKEIKYIINYYFRNVKVIRSSLPFFFKTKHSSFYAYIESIK